MTATIPETDTHALGLLQDFASLPDPRQQHKIDHLLIDIITIAILGVICGADDYDGIAEFGRDNEVWLKTALAKNIVCLYGGFRVSG